MTDGKRALRNKLVLAFSLGVGSIIVLLFETGILPVKKAEESAFPSAKVAESNSATVPTIERLSELTEERGETGQPVEGGIATSQSEAWPPKGTQNVFICSDVPGVFAGGYRFRIAEWYDGLDGGQGGWKYASLGTHGLCDPSKGGLQVVSPGQPDASIPSYPSAEHVAAHWTPGTHPKGCTADGTIRQFRDNGTTYQSSSPCTIAP